MDFTDKRFLCRGKLLGGSSSINAMVWMVCSLPYHLIRRSLTYPTLKRAAKAEYDALETTFQNEGWNFDSLKEYFRKSQSHTVQPSEIFPDSKVLPDVHGTDGPVKVWSVSSDIVAFFQFTPLVDFAKLVVLYTR